MQRKRSKPFNNRAFGQKREATETPVLSNIIRSYTHWNNLVNYDIISSEYTNAFDAGVRRVYRYRIASGSLLIQTILKTTDQETVAQIRENPYLQYFLGLKAYTMKSIIDSSLLARFRKRLSPEDWQALNEALVNTFKKKESEKETGTKALSLETKREETEEPPSADA